MIKLYLTNLQAFDDITFYEETYNKMSDFRKSKTDRLKMDKDKKASVAAGFLLNYALNEYGYNESKQQYALSSHQKPYFKDIPNLFFNISHSGNYILLGISDTEIGLDIQQMIKKNQNIAKRFFSEKENTFLNSQPKDLKEKYFFKLWSAKESYLKYTGEGLTRELSSFCVQYSKDLIKIAEDSSVFIKEYSSIPDYCICVCSTIDSFPKEIIII